MNNSIIIEFEKGKYLVSMILNKKQLQELNRLIEPKSRSWRGQYQEFTKAFVKAYNDLKS